MSQCIYIKECSYINGTIKNEKAFKEVFKSNFCKYYYKKCAIWKIAHNFGMKNVPKNLLPFQHTMLHHKKYEDVL
ncbi:hypothetical protein SAMN02745912_00115 [Paramaledivibacter caminithermalis DSM 15212]|jgi:hypothetical protein|uniref:Uncharacterized protein n=1 Tax=Paramaledivibacter caminithermalis (strain DSM 15212 / CIP 107654 / DViRD3) TaxID=1121301 RepID=A0A1M6JRK1_PARC5|nr:hypothetical protein SAMN02745912_00115 [Paramaledivibacter caminithermalis DSM 15212]